MGTFFSRIFGGLGSISSDRQSSDSQAGVAVVSTDAPANIPANADTATFGAGCFWCVDELFRQLKGVVRVESGYAGGQTHNPSYRDVCSGNTGHAEVVQVTFDPTVISYRDLLKVFFTIHDPTTLNRQGADVGTQYRSVVLYNTPEQRETAEQVIAEFTEARVWDRSIVTELAPITTFYAAEQVHQEYYSRNPRQQYCQIVIAPKVAKFRKRYMDKLRA